MAIVFNENIVNSIAGWLAGTSAPGPGFSSSWSIKLYRNDYTPVTTSVASNFTEANYPGYSAKSLLMTAVKEGSSYRIYGSVTFTATDTFTPSQTIYGWYGVKGSNDSYVIAERLPSSVAVTLSGDLVVVTIDIYLPI